MDGIKSLLKSRKFWLAVFALVQSVVMEYFNVPAEVWQAIDAIIAVLIASIAAEDVGKSLSRNGLR